MKLTARSSTTGAVRPPAVSNFSVHRTEVLHSGLLKPHRTTGPESTPLLKRSLWALPSSHDLRKSGHRAAIRAALATRMRLSCRAG